MANNFIEENKQDNAIAVLVASFDGYSDVWDPFFHFFFKYWKDCPFPVYLGTNSLDYSHPHVNVIKVGKESDYSSNLIKMLSKIEQEWVIFTVEDIFFSKKIDTIKLNSLIEKAKRENSSCLQLLYKPLNQNNLIYKNNKISEDFAELPKGTPYRTALNLGFWKKNVLLKLLKSGESAWQFEFNGTLRSFDLDYRFLAVTENHKNLFTFVHGIIKRKWTWEAKKYFAQKRKLEYIGNRYVQPYLSHIYQKLYAYTRFILFALIYFITGPKWFLSLQKEWKKS